MATTTYGAYSSGRRFFSGYKTYERSLGKTKLYSRGRTRKRRPSAYKARSGKRNLIPRPRSQYTHKVSRFHRRGPV